MAYLFVFGLLTIILFSVSWTAINYKIKAGKLGVNISWSQVIGQRLRKTLSEDILIAASLAKREKLEIEVGQLETHKLAGGDPLKVVKEIVENKSKGQTLTYSEATALDLGGDELRKFWTENKK